MDGGVSAPRIVIAAGGTAGHVVPAIAVADALRAEGAEVSFVGGERAEAELVPAAGYEIDTINVEGISRTNPLKAARARRQGGAAVARRRADPRAPPRRRRPRRRRLRRRARSASRRSLREDPARAHRGRLAPRPHQPRCWPRARAASASRSRSRAATASATCVTGRAGPADDHRPRRTPAPQLGIGRTRPACCLRRLARRALDQHGRAEAFADAPYRVVHVAGAPRLRRTSRPRPALRAARLPDAVRDRARRRRRRRRPRRRLGVRARPVRPAVGADPVPARVRPTTRRPTRAGWPSAARRTILPDAELTPERLRAETDALSTTSRARRWRRRRRSRGPTRAGDRPRGAGRRRHTSSAKCNRLRPLSVPCQRTASRDLRSSRSS